MGWGYGLKRFVDDSGDCENDSRFDSHNPWESAGKKLVKGTTEAFETKPGVFIPQICRIQKNLNCRINGYKTA